MVVAKNVHHGSYHLASAEVLTLQTHRIITEWTQPDAHHARLVSSRPWWCEDLRPQHSKALHKL